MSTVNSRLQFLISAKNQTGPAFAFDAAALDVVRIATQERLKAFFASVEKRIRYELGDGKPQN
jgi:hypothetical protein